MRCDDIAQALWSSWEGYPRSGLDIDLLSVTGAYFQNQEWIQVRYRSAFNPEIPALGFSFPLDDESEADAVSLLKSAIIDDLNEPLGCYEDSLAELDGTWWWSYEDAAGNMLLPVNGVWRIGPPKP